MVAEQKIQFFTSVFTASLILVAWCSWNHVHGHRENPYDHQSYCHPPLMKILIVVLLIPECLPLTSVQIVNNFFCKCTHCVQKGKWYSEVDVFYGLVSIAYITFDWNLSYNCLTCKEIFEGAVGLYILLCVKTWKVVFFLFCKSVLNSAFVFIMCIVNEKSVSFFFFFCCVNFILFKIVTENCEWFYRPSLLYFKIWDLMKYANAAFAFQIIGALVLIFLSADCILDKICGDYSIGIPLCNLAVI